MTDAPDDHQTPLRAPRPLGTRIPSRGRDPRRVGDIAAAAPSEISARPLDWPKPAAVGNFALPAQRGALSAPRKADILLKTVAAVVVTYVWRVQDMISPLSKLKLPTLIALVALALYLMDTREVRRLRHVQSRLLLLLFALAVIIAAGVPTSVLPSGSFDFLTKDFLPDVLMVLVVGASVRCTRDVERLLGAHIAGAIAYSVYALMFFRVDASGRLGGLLYYDANDFALAIVCTLPVTFYFLRDGSPRWQRRLALCAIPLLLLNFVRAASRGGFLGLTTIVLLSLVGYHPIKMRKRVLSVLLVLVGISAIGGGAFWDKMRSILEPENDYNMQSDTGRWQLWQNGLSLIRQRPFLGVGARQFGEASATMSDFARERIALNEGRVPWQPAHNAYVSIAAETGVGGFLVFVSMLIGSLVAALRLKRQVEQLPGGGRDYAALARALAISLVGYMVSAFFLTAEYEAVLYLDIGILLALRKLVRMSAAMQPACAPSRRGVSQPEPQAVGCPPKRGLPVPLAGWR